MGVYSKLGEALAARQGETWKVGFSEIERVIGRKLPASAWKYPAWWSNNPSNNSMTKVWLKAGWRTGEVDVPGQTVVFRRVSAAGRGGEAGFGDRPRNFEYAARPPDLEYKAFGGGAPVHETKAAAGGRPSGRPAREAGADRVAAARRGQGPGAEAKPAAPLERRAKKWNPVFRPGREAANLLSARVRARAGATTKDAIGGGRAPPPDDRKEDPLTSVEEFLAGLPEEHPLIDLFDFLKATVTLAPELDPCAPACTPEEWKEAEAEMEAEWDTLYGPDSDVAKDQAKGVKAP